MLSLLPCLGIFFPVLDLMSAFSLFLKSVSHGTLPTPLLSPGGERRESFTCNTRELCADNLPVLASRQGLLAMGD